MRIASLISSLAAFGMTLYILWYVYHEAQGGVALYLWPVPALLALVGLILGLFSKVKWAYWSAFALIVVQVWFYSRLVG
ncbi:MAG TPA: hypothetical protein VM901_10110 [Bdellovibrionota bacterium]|jgi:hypothetical protein|nr:hypothetical protein [Bdellovibrionota bacterium]